MNPHLHSTNELRPDRWNSSHFILNDVNLETSLNLTVAVSVESAQIQKTHTHLHTQTDNRPLQLTALGLGWNIFKCKAFYS